MKKLFVLFLALMLALTGMAFAEEAEAPALTSDVVVLFTSDVHCGVDQNFGYVGLKAVKNSLEAAGNHVLLVDDGDSIQGEPMGTMTRGEANIQLMNALG